MTESEWQECTDPAAMVAHLKESGAATDRKLRLFACACCRRLWHLLPNKDAKNAVETAERIADGAAEERELAAAFAAVWPAVEGEFELPVMRQANKPHAKIQAEIAAAASAVVASGGTDCVSAWLAVPKYVDYQWALNKPVWLLATEGLAQDAFEGIFILSEEQLQLQRIWSRHEVRQACNARYSRADKAYEERHSQALKEAADLLRDLFGNTFKPVPVDLGVLTWNCSTIPKLARAIYDHRRFEDMPVLADALEDAGCTDAEILKHCREGSKPPEIVKPPLHTFREQASCDLPLFKDAPDFGAWVEHVANEPRTPKPFRFPGNLHAPGCWVLDLLLSKNAT